MINMSSVFIFIIFAICSIFKPCLFASKVPSQSLEPKDLQELKGLYFDKQQFLDLSRDERQQKNERLFAKINSASAEDETVILSFIKTEFMSLEIAGDDDYKNIDYVLIPLCKQLREVGGKDTVELFFQWLSQSNWNPEVGLPFRLADTIMRISGRIQIDKERLRPLMDSKNQNLAALATQMYQCLSYNDVPSDIEEVIRYGVSKRDIFENLTGEMYSWRTIAHERGFIINTNVSSENLLNLVLDCDKRIANIQKSIKEGTLGNQESKHMRDWEDSFRFHVITELIENNKEKAFDYLVSKMEQGDGGTLEAYFLYEMTGNHFPVCGYISYPRWGRIKVDLARKAAAAWREWRKTNKLQELTSSQKDVVDLEKRLSDFQSKRRQIDQKEYLRPIDNVISELLSTNDKRVQNMLVDVIFCKTLTDEQVQRIITSAKESRSESQRIILWQVLWNSSNSDARAYVNSVINKNTEESVVIKFLEPINSIKLEDVTFLVGLYSGHPSALVRQRVVQIACSRSFNRDEEPPMKMIESILAVSKNNDHKLALLRAAYRQSGPNVRGGTIVRNALKNEESPELKRTLYKELIQDSPESWLGFLLNNQEPEEIMLDGLLAFKSAILENRIRTWSLRSDVLNTLMRISEHDSSEKVKLAAEEIVTELRKKEINELIDGQKRLITSFETMVEKGMIDENMKRELEQTSNSAFGEMLINSKIEDIKDKYGKLPEEEYLKSELKKIRKTQIELINKVLDSEN